MHKTTVLAACFEVLPLNSGSYVEATFSHFHSVFLLFLHDEYREQQRRQDVGDFLPNMRRGNGVSCMHDSTRRGAVCASETNCGSNSQISRLIEQQSMLSMAFIVSSTAALKIPCGRYVGVLVEVRNSVTPIFKVSPWISMSHNALLYDSFNDGLRKYG